MSEIPADAKQEKADAAKLIAGAIMAERERCAKVAEREVPMSHAPGIESIGRLLEPAYRDGPKIAAEIRSGN